jgi:hypothetical protein
MTGYESKRAAARDKLEDDDALTIAYQSGYYDGKKAAQRPWVGLTAEEAVECCTTTATQTWKNFEAKLKEKNT